ncbi:MAG: ArsR family transcriptional regulator [Ignavibacteriales bacterium]|nr:MAG: ArsR family transcriptional regulator [Ignavibacteriales bacterium]
MATAKINEFEKEAIYLADIAKALSHPARIQILKILTEMDVCMCGDIVELLPLAQSTVSQHLKELQRVGLIKGDIDGPKVCYCVNPDNLNKAKKEFEIIFNLYTCKGAKSCRTKKK